MAAREEVWPGLRVVQAPAGRAGLPGSLAGWDGGEADRAELALYLHWATAFDRWLAGLAPSTGRAYRRAWDDLCAFSEKGPEAILSADVQEWAEDLGQRALDPVVLRGLRRKGRRADGEALGLSPATIAQWLSAVSSFYRFVCTKYLVRTEDGGERPLHGYNPAANVRRPAVEAYTESEFLDARGLARLLGAIPRDRVGGLRDYALFLGYVLTGRRNAEWRQIRWGDLRGRGARIYYTWRGKNTEQARNELPPPVWEAIRDYLEGAGRLGTMGPGDFVFRALSDRATRRTNDVRLPNVDGEAWDGNRAISAGEVNRLLKRYARLAGLDEGRMHVHVLRHSTAMLEEEVGTSLARISEFLGHSDPKTTMRYLRHLRGEGDETWEGKARLLGL